MDTRHCARTDPQEAWGSAEHHLGDQHAGGTQSDATKATAARLSAGTGSGRAVAARDIPVLVFRAEKGEAKLYFWDESGFHADAVHGKVWAERSHHQLQAVADNPQLVRSFFKHPSIVCIGDCWVGAMVKKIAIIIPVHNRKEITLRCLERLSVTELRNYQLDVIVVDDGSVDGTAEAVTQQHPDVALVKGDGNLWWTGAVNRGVEYALAYDYNYFMLLNDDVEWGRDCFQELLDVADRHPQALVSSIKLMLGEGSGIDRDNQNQIILTGCLREQGILREICDSVSGRPYRVVKNVEVLSCDALTGAALLIPKSVFDAIGVFDAKSFPHNWGDIEFTHRAKRAGWECLVAVRSRVYTASNPRYQKHYILTSGRWEYVRSLLRHDLRYNFSIHALRKRAFMHRGCVTGSIVFVKYMLGALRRVVRKCLLPNGFLARNLR